MKNAMMCLIESLMNEVKLNKVPYTIKQFGQLFSLLVYTPCNQTLLQFVGFEVPNLDSVYFTLLYVPCIQSSTE